MTIGSSLTTIQNIVYFEDAGYETDFISSGNMSKWKVASFSEVIKLGTENPVVPSLPSSHSIAVVMYTSGSTGLPKVYSHFSSDYFIFFGQSHANLCQDSTFSRTVS